jgi:hypothetical protein
MQATIVRVAMVPVALRPEIQTANDLRTNEIAQPGPTSVQIDALLGLLLFGILMRPSP